jgi:microcystin-dependent protein
MSDPYIGEIRLFGGIWVPSGWLPCDGRQLTISGNEQLYSLIGLTYGGDGRTNFNLPDLRGLVVCGTGRGAGLTNTYGLGQTFGSTMAQVTIAQMPVHRHDMLVSKQVAESSSPQSAWFAAPPQLSGSTVLEYVNGTPAPPTRNLATNALSTTGASEPHLNLMPTVGIAYIICGVGLYPQFN